MVARKNGQKKVLLITRTFKQRRKSQQNKTERTQCEEVNQKCTTNSPFPY